MISRLARAAWCRGMAGFLPRTPRACMGSQNPGVVNLLGVLNGISGRPHFLQMKYTTDASLPLAGSIDVKKISSTISLYSKSSVGEEPHRPSETTRPLLLLLPWLGSKSSAIMRYCQLYLEPGFDVLVVESSVRHFLWPRHGMAYAAEIAELLKNEKAFSSRPLYVHAFSIGAYTFTMMLLHMGQHRQQYRGTMQRIKGQVYDSLVIGSVEKMAIGVAKMISSHWQPVVKSSVLLYFSLLKRYTVDYYNDAINVFWQDPPTCPALLFYCEDDPLSDHVLVAQLIETWRKRGINVVGKGWQNSKHAGHLRRHPQEYRDTLNNFLQQQHTDTPFKSKL
ncbi:transmembrane protein 53-like [Lissotriton helveticus]